MSAAEFIQGAAATPPFCFMRMIPKSLSPA
jgi:hypothetical protein